MVLRIFEYLSAYDLCIVSAVCRHWFVLASDHILWGQCLKHEVQTWTSILNTTNPILYEEAGCHPKDM